MTQTHLVDRATAFVDDSTITAVEYWARRICIEHGRDPDANVYPSWEAGPKGSVIITGAKLFAWQLYVTDAHARYFTAPAPAPKPGSLARLKAWYARVIARSYRDGPGEP